MSEFDQEIPQKQTVHNFTLKQFGYLNLCSRAYSTCTRTILLPTVLHLRFNKAGKACSGDCDAKIVCTFKLHVFSVISNAAWNMTTMGQQGSAAMSGGKLSFDLYGPVHVISNNVV